MHVSLFYSFGRDNRLVDAWVRLLKTILQTSFEKSMILISHPDINAQIMARCGDEKKVVIPHKVAHHISKETFKC